MGYEVGGAKIDYQGYFQSGASQLGYDTKAQWGFVDLCRRVMERRLGYLMQIETR